MNSTKYTLHGMIIETYNGTRYNFVNGNYVPENEECERAILCCSNSNGKFEITLYLEQSICDLLENLNSYCEITIEPVLYWSRNFTHIPLKKRRFRIFENPNIIKCKYFYYSYCGPRRWEASGYYHINYDQFHYCNINNEIELK